MVESKHPYENNEDWTKQAHFPGAKRIVLKWDPQTSTESGCDWVRVFKNNNPDHHVYERRELSGDYSANNWPEAQIEGTDMISFRFYSDGSCTRWGFKCTATATIEQEVAAVPWKGDLAVQLATVLSSITNRMCGAEPTISPAIAKILDSPLFSGGISNASLGRLVGFEVHLNDALQASLEQFSNIIGSDKLIRTATAGTQTQAQQFALQMINDEGAGGTVVQAVFDASKQKMLGKSPLLCALFACIVYHGGMMDEAQAFGESIGLCDVPPSLENAWSRAKAAYMAMAQQRQNMEPEAKAQHVSHTTHFGIRGGLPRLSCSHTHAVVIMMTCGRMAG